MSKFKCEKTLSSVYIFMANEVNILKTGAPKIIIIFVLKMILLGLTVQ